MTRLSVFALSFLGMMSVGTVAAAPVQLAGLNRLEHGAWEVRARGASANVQQLCVGDPRQLLQPQHLGSSCSRYIVADGANEITVTYNCQAAGSGRTDLRIETPRLVQIQSQGVANRAPFSVSLEARRIGNCS